MRSLMLFQHRLQGIAVKASPLVMGVHVSLLRGVVRKGKYILFKLI